MYSPVCALRIASILFGLMSLGQLTRIFLHVYVQVGSHIVGRRYSLAAAIVLAALCVWLWMVACKAKEAAAAAPGKPAA